MTADRHGWFSLWKRIALIVLEVPAGDEAAEKDQVRDAAPQHDVDDAAGAAEGTARDPFI